MNTNSWLFASDLPSGPAKSLAIQRRTDEIAAETFARIEKRRLALEELRSVLYLPPDRIRAWERLHGLTLPSDSKHPILASVALSTGLTLTQVREEQEARSAKTGVRANSPGVYG